MERVRFIEYEGKKILHEDFSKLNPGKEFNEVIEFARDLIGQQDGKQLLILFDATDTVFDKSILDQMKQFARDNTPHVRASALVGVSGLLKVALTAVVKFSGRNYKTFSTNQEALDWLIQQ